MPETTANSQLLDAACFSDQPKAKVDVPEITGNSLLSAVVSIRSRYRETLCAEPVRIAPGQMHLLIRTAANFSALFGGSN
jgi:hypothetical protein